MEIKTYIEKLFSYLDTYESRYAEFQTEAFLQTYNGINAVFHALRQQRADAIDVDQFFLGKIRQAPLTSSDLRQVTVQILITFFESEADTDGQSAQAYSYCRGLRPVKQDIPFFENHLLPLLFEEGGLNNNGQLRMFLVGEIARYLNKFGRRLEPNIAPESFLAMPDPLKILELQRRRLELGTGMLADRTSLEFHLQRVDFFTKLQARGKMYEQPLLDWGYLRSSDFWGKLKAGLSELGGKFMGAFSSFGYFRLILSQRNPAYVYYSVMIILFIWLAIYVPMKWQDYSNQQLLEFQHKADTMQGSGR